MLQKNFEKFTKYAKRLTKTEKILLLFIILTQ